VWGVRAAARGRRDIRKSRQESRRVARHPAGDSKTGVGGVGGRVRFPGSRIIAAQLGRTIFGAPSASGAHHGAHDGDGALGTAPIAKVRTIRRIMVRTKNAVKSVALWCAMMREKTSDPPAFHAAPGFWLPASSYARCNVQRVRMKRND